MKVSLKDANPPYKGCLYISNDRLVLVREHIPGFPLMPNQGKKKRKGRGREAEIVPELGVDGGRKRSVKPSLEPPHV